MTDEIAPRRGLRRMLARFLFASVVAGPAASASPDVDVRDVRDDVAKSEDDPDDVDDETIERAVASLVAASDRGAAGNALARLLDKLEPFDATRTAALTALSPRVDVRRALADALASSRFPLVGARFALDLLTHDPDRGVRDAAARALDGRIGVVMKWPGAPA